jgi:putative hydrolase of the HAD superfamily
VGKEKPDPGIFHVALERVGAEAAEAMHVGDLVPTDVWGARAAGITPVLIDRDDLHPDDDYARITRLDAIIDLLEGKL